MLGKRDLFAYLIKTLDDPVANGSGSIQRMSHGAFRKGVIGVMTESVCLNKDKRLVDLWSILKL